MEVQLEGEKTFNIIVLKENIRNSGQHVESFTLEVHQNNCWKRIFEGSVIGYKRICCFNQTNAGRIRLRITASRLYPTIEYFGVFYQT